MLELVLLLLFVGAPWALGYGTARYWPTVLPAGVLVVAVLKYAARQPPEYRDEVNVWAGLSVMLCALAVLACLAGAAVRRRSRSRS